MPSSKDNVHVLYIQKAKKSKRFYLQKARHFAKKQDNFRYVFIHKKHDTLRYAISAKKFWVGIYIEKS